MTNSISTPSFIKLEGTLTDSEGNKVHIRSTRGRFGEVEINLDGSVNRVIYEMFPDPDNQGRIYELRKDDLA